MKQGQLTEARGRDFVMSAFGGTHDDPRPLAEALKRLMYVHYDEVCDLLNKPSERHKRVETHVLDILLRHAKIWIDDREVIFGGPMHERDDHDCVRLWIANTLCDWYEDDIELMYDCPRECGGICY